MRMTTGQIKRYARKLRRTEQLMRKYNFESGPLMGKAKRRLFKWMNAFNKLTRRIIK